MIKFCGNSKSTGVRCAADRIEHQVKASEWLSCPVAGDGAEQPMFDVIPFGGPARVVANGYCNAIFVGPSLKFTFPESRAMPIAAATVGRDQQFGCVGILLSSPTLPPTPNRTHSKLWRVGRRSNANVPSLLGHVVNAVRDCPAFGISREIVHGYCVRLLSPQPAIVLEIADQFGVLGINTDGRQALFRKAAFLTLDIAKLAVPIWMWRSRQAFHVGTQRIAEFSQQPANRHMRQGFQSLGERSQTTTNVLPFARWVAADMTTDQCFQAIFDTRIFFSKGGRPAPLRRMRSVGQSSRLLSSSSRPRLIVFGSTPVICEISVSPPLPEALDSNPATQRRCCSFNRPKTKRACSAQRSASCITRPPFQSIENRRPTCTSKPDFRK